MRETKSQRMVKHMGIQVEYEESREQGKHDVDFDIDELESGVEETDRYDGSVGVDGDIQDALDNLNDDAETEASS